MRYTDEVSNWKLHILQVISFLCGIAIITRLYHLQVYEHETFAKLGKKNFLRIQTVPSPRGDIIDIHGNLLATNMPITHLYWQGTGNKEIAPDQHHILELAQIILSSADTQFTIPLQQIKFAERFGTRVKIADELTYEQLSQISEQCMQSQNLVITTHFKRYYPYGSLACHILGYLGDIHIQSQGKMGLEKLFEPTLQGQHGLVQTTINSFGRQLAQEQLQRVQKGGSLQTTLDIKLQQLAEQCFPEIDSGTFILLDPRTGALRALVSRPGFDPTLFLKPISSETWQELQEKSKPFLNRAFHAMYPPASTFKLITLSAALETHIVHPDTKVFCSGYTTFANRKYHCNNRHGHGKVGIQDSIAHSCNILFYEIAKHVHIDTLADYANRFGLGESTQVIFGDKQGLVPSNEWKIINKGERWWQGETLSAAIGQSFLLVTPIQIACMIAGIFEGYLVQPRISDQEPIIKKPIHVKPETRTILQEFMRSVITTGTGKRISNLKHLKIYAKTGTAQTVALKDGDKDQEIQERLHKEHAWFVSYFSYKDEEPLVMIILIEHAGSSKYATGIAKQFLLKYLKLKKEAT